MRELKLLESAHPRGPRRTDSVPRALWAEGGAGLEGAGAGGGWWHRRCTAHAQALVRGPGHLESWTLRFSAHSAPFLVNSSFSLLPLASHSRVPQVSLRVRVSCSPLTFQNLLVKS